MYQPSTNITQEYCQKMHYKYVRSSVFFASNCSPLLCYRSVTTALTAQIPMETLSQSHRLCFMLLCYNHAKTTTFSAQSFTGKERDSETGFSYFGARYYDSDILTGWLSVDPMADKYPSISPYAYCAWNPVKLVDLDGRKIDSTSMNESIRNLITENVYFSEAVDALAKDERNIYKFVPMDKPIITSINKKEDKVLKGNLVCEGVTNGVGVININFLKEETNMVLFEEVAHALQVISGEIGFAFNAGKEWTTIGMDVYDEVNAKNWALKATGNNRILSTEDLNKNYKDLRKNSQSAYQYYKDEYLPNNPSYSEASFSSDGWIIHPYFHFKR